jgi:hypothetical protein
LVENALTRHSFLDLEAFNQLNFVVVCEVTELLCKAHVIKHLAHCFNILVFDFFICKRLIAIVVNPNQLLLQLYKVSFTRTYHHLSVTELFCCPCALAIGQVKLHVIVERILNLGLLSLVSDPREEVPHQDVLSDARRHPFALLTQL